MNFNLSNARPLIALGVGFALTLTACGGDDDAAATTDPPSTTDAPADAAGEGPAMQPASITVDAQDSDGETITIASVELPAPGFIAVHGDGGGSPGPVIGNSDLLPAGVSTDVVVSLDSALDGDTTLYPMVHIDTNDNGLYEFGQVDGADGPGLTAAGDVAVIGAAITVAGGTTDAGADDAGAPDATGENAINIADFAFSGVTEVALGTTIVVTNLDGTPHTWTAEDGSFDAGAIAPGESFEFTFDTPGEFAYFCNIHPSMTGTITVTG